MFMVDLRLPTLLTLNDLETLYVLSKTNTKTVGLCHGCFDLTHWGHFLHFEQAKSMVDILIVSITIDLLVTKSKGNERPYYNNSQRLIMLNSNSFIDHTYVCSQERSDQILKILRPSYYFKGQDYSDNSKHPGLIMEKEICKSLGTKVYYTTCDNYSTTNLVNKIKGNELL